MGQFIVNVTEVRHETGAHVAIVHHGTKASNGSSPRGHSCLTGADDALVEVVKLDDGSRVATVAHAKDDVMVCAGDSTLIWSSLVSTRTAIQSPR